MLAAQNVCCDDYLDLKPSLQDVAEKGPAARVIIFTGEHA